MKKKKKIITALVVFSVIVGSLYLVNLTTCSKLKEGMDLKDVDKIFYGTSYEYVDMNKHPYNSLDNSFIYGRFYFTEKNNFVCMVGFDTQDKVNLIVIDD